MSAFDIDDVRVLFAWSEDIEQGLILKAILASRYLLSCVLISNINVFTGLKKALSFYFNS